MDYKDLPAQEVFHWFKEINQIQEDQATKREFLIFYTIGLRKEI